MKKRNYAENHCGKTDKKNADLQQIIESYVTHMQHLLSSKIKYLTRRELTVLYVLAVQLLFYHKSNILSNLAKQSRLTKAEK
ncbi:MAG: hypothetical protein HDT48_00610 [Ruminococcaceae bacterium]|nr:hypothetical protein [Oscillospiraceae bacterium]